MTSSGCEHLVEGELSVQIPLDDVDPLRVARLAAQLLRTKDKKKNICQLLRTLVRLWQEAAIQIKDLGADLELFLILLPLHFGPGEVEPSSAPQGRRDPLLAALFHLPVADR